MRVEPDEEEISLEDPIDINSEISPKDTIRIYEDDDDYACSPDD